MPRSRYLNGVLTVIAGLLALQVLDGATSPGRLAGAVEAEARAQGGDQPSEGGLVSAADQRKIMIAELKRLGAKLDAIDARLKAGLAVKVTDMPEIKMPAAPGGAASPK